VDVIVQPMFTDGVETLVGLTSDPMFGPLVAFGLGGVNVDVFRDVAFRVAPLTDREADDLLHSVRGFQLLQNHRGGQPSISSAPRRGAASRLSRRTDPRTARAGFEPVIARPSGYEVVDVRARVGPYSRR
jgi:hypothetical protein